MPLTPQEEARYQELWSQIAPTPTAAIPPTPQPISKFGRVFKGLANAPSEALQGILHGAQGLLELPIPQEYKTPETEIPKPFNIPQAQGWGDIAASLPGHLAALAGQIAAPELAATKLGKVAGLGDEAANILGSTLGWAGTGADQGRDEMLAQGAQGATFRALDYLPRNQRLPISALLGLGSGLYYANQPTGTAEQGTAMGAANALLPLLMGHHPSPSAFAGHTWENTATWMNDVLPNQVSREVEGATLNVHPYGDLGHYNAFTGAIHPQDLTDPATELATHYSALEQQRILGEQVRGYPLAFKPASESAGIINELGQVSEREGTAIPTAFEHPPEVKSALESAQTIDQSLSQMERLRQSPAGREGLLQQLQNETEAASRARIANATLGQFESQPPVRGKLQSLPEYQRTQGGFVDPSTINIAGQTVAGGIIGGAQPADSPSERLRNALIGASIGVASGHMTNQFARDLFGEQGRMNSGKFATVAKSPEAVAKVANTEFQGEANGLLTFKDLKTNGNFSIKSVEFTPELFQVKLDAVRKSFDESPPLSVDEALKQVGFIPKIHTLEDIKNIANRSGKVRVWHGTSNLEKILTEGFIPLNSGEDAAKRIASIYEIPWIEFQNKITKNAGYGKETSKISTAPYEVAKLWKNYKYGEVLTQINSDARIYLESKRSGKSIDELYDLAKQISKDRKTQFTFNNAPDLLNLPDKLSGVKSGIVEGVVDARDIPQHISNIAKSTLTAIASGQISEELGIKSWNETYKDIKVNPFKIKNLKDAGFILPELNRAVAGGLVGGLTGGVIDRDNSTEGAIVGGMLGALGGAFGPELARFMVKELANIKVGKPSGIPSLSKDFANLAKAFVSEAAVTTERMSGAGMRGSGSVAERFINYLDREGNLTMPRTVVRALIEAKGSAAVLLDNLDRALKKISIGFKADDALKDLSNKFLDGDISSADFLAKVKAGWTDPKSQNYAQYLLTARESVNGLQSMVAQAMTDPRKAKMISDSIGAYVTRSYKLFNDPRWRPTDQQINAVLSEMSTLPTFSGKSLGELRSYIEEYIHEVKQTKGMYGFTGSSSGSSTPSAAIDQQVLKRRKDLSDAWKDMLGEIRDPSQRINQTIGRLRPMAEASNYFRDLTTGLKDEGIPLFFNSQAEIDTFSQGLKTKQAALSPNSSEFATIAKQLLQLDHFRQVDSKAMYGPLGGGFVSRNVHDTLRTFESATQMTGPLWRSLNATTLAAKMSRTMFNPLNVVRNIVTVPFFLMAGRANPAHWVDAVKTVLDATHPLRKEMLEQGIITADQVKGEFYNELNSLMGGNLHLGDLDLTSFGLGKLDLSIAEHAIKRGAKMVGDFYRAPDVFTRAATYLAAKQRISDQLGKAITDSEVIRAATDWTDRYTINYANVAPAIKSLRQLPFTNLFISYVSESARITKNLAMDLISHPDASQRIYAASALGVISAMPEVLNIQAESSLSEKDRADWNKLKALLPDYARTRYYADIQRQKDGSFHFVDYTPLLTNDSLQQTVRALLSGDAKAIAAVNPILGWQNTPALNVVIEQAVGKDLHTYRDFRGVEDRVANVIKEYVPPWFPGIGNEASRIGRAFTPTEKGDLGITNLGTGKRVTPEDLLLEYVSSVRPASGNLQVLQKRAVTDAKNELGNLKAYLYDVARSDANQELKQKALNQYRESATQVINSLRSRLGTVPAEVQPSP